MVEVQDGSQSQEVTPESKWPNFLLFARHGETDFNADKAVKKADPLYQQMRRLMDEDPYGEEVKTLARQVDEKYPRRYSNRQMPLTERGELMAFQTGQGLKEMYERGEIPMPDVIYLPPLARNRKTLAKMTEGWTALADVKTVEDERIRERDFGVIAETYTDQYAYLALHPEELRARRFLGDMADYDQRYMGGENIPDMMLRMGSFFSMLIREYSGKNVMIVGNHLLLQTMLSLLRRYTPEQYIEMDHTEDPTRRPINCGVTIFESDPTQGKQGKLVEKAYNLKLYTA